MGIMTDAQGPVAGGSPPVDAAVEAADAAARAAGVSLRELTNIEELAAVYRLFGRIWQPDPTNPPVTTDLLCALAKAGNYVVGAFEKDELVGACVGFFGAPGAGTMHSHIAGVSPAASGRGVGYALKLHQRAWTLLRGASVICWTFDPLVARNAYFNIVKLAARPVEYLPNFYGTMRDGINGSGESDRLLMRWQLDSPEVGSACLGTAPMLGAGAGAGAAYDGRVVSALASTPTGTPVVGSLDSPMVSVAVPRDIEDLRRSKPKLANHWRSAVREVLGGLLATGATVTGFDRLGGYVVTTHAVTGPPATTKVALA